jgi:hypothetical protein
MNSQCVIVNSVPRDIHLEILSFLNLHDSVVKVMPLNQYFNKLIENFQITLLKQDIEHWLKWLKRMGNNPMAQMDYCTGLTMLQMTRVQVMIYTFIFDQQIRSRMYDELNTDQRQYLIILARRLQLDISVPTIVRKPEEWIFTYAIYKTPTCISFNDWVCYHRLFDLMTNKTRDVENMLASFILNPILREISYSKLKGLDRKYIHYLAFCLHIRSKSTGPEYNRVLTLIKPNDWIFEPHRLRRSSQEIMDNERQHNSIKVIPPTTSVKRRRITCDLCDGIVEEVGPLYQSDFGRVCETCLESDDE